MTDEEISAGARRIFIDWLRTQRLRADPVGDIARLAERGRRRIGRSYTFHDLDAAVTRASRRHSEARRAFVQAVHEFFTWLRCVVHRRQLN